MIINSSYSRPGIIITDIDIIGEDVAYETDTITLTAIVTPSDATRTAVKWAIASGEEYASIVSYTDSTCTLTFTGGTGEVAVTATSTDYTEISATHSIEVREYHTIMIDTDMMLTDPTECIQYGNQMSPVVNESETLATATDEGSWGFDRETGMDRDGLFYATFQSGDEGQYLHELLDPYDLTKYIAIWNDEDKAWDYSQTGDSSITTENTMLCIPRAFIKTVIEDNMTYVDLFFDKSVETLDDVKPYSHTIDDVVYDYLAIGVYPNTHVTSSESYVLMSLSESTMSALRLSTARIRANANTVRNGHGMLWNFHHWDLWKTLTYVRLKSFNSDRLGRAYYGTAYTYNVGDYNALGPFAGATSDVGFKCLIEGMCCGPAQWLDDVYYYTTSQIATGTNSVPTSDLSNKLIFVNYAYASSAYYGGKLLGNTIGWSMPDSDGSGLTTGACSYVQPISASYPVMAVGRYTTNSVCGIGASTRSTDTASTTGYSRLAFVFNP